MGGHYISGSDSSKLRSGTVNLERPELAVGWRGVGSALVSVARNNISVLPG